MFSSADWNCWPQCNPAAKELSADLKIFVIVTNATKHKVNASLVFVMTEFSIDLSKDSDWMRIYCFAVCPNSAKLLSIKLIWRNC